MLISKLNIENGSLIDQVTGLQATIVGSKMKLGQTPDKGFMLSNDGTTGDYIDIPNSTTMTNTGDWSVAIGYRDISTISTMGYISKYNHTDNSGFAIIKASGNMLVAYGTGVRYIQNLNKDSYNFLIVTFSNNILNFYSNGIKLTSLSVTTSINNQIIRIGTYYSSLTGFNLRSKVGTPSIYNHALTQKEIDNLYTQWLTPKPTINLIRESEITLPNDYTNEVNNTLINTNILIINSTNWSQSLSQGSAVLSNGTAVINNGIGDIYISGQRPLQNNIKFKFTCTIINKTQGRVYLMDYNGNNYGYLNNGDNSFDITPTNVGIAGRLYLHCIEGFTGTITTPIVYEYTGLVAAYSGNLTPDRLWVDKSNNLKNLVTYGNPINIKNGIYINGKSGFTSTVKTELNKTLSFSIISSIKTSNDITTYQSIISNFIFAARFQVFISNGYLQVQFHTSGTNTGYSARFTILTNHKYNILINYTPTIFNLYVNNTLVIGDTSNVIELANTGAFAIGLNSVGNSSGFNGNIEEVKIYNRVQTSVEISKYFKSKIKPVLIENFNYGADGVTKNIDNWIKKSGSFKISEFVRSSTQFIGNSTMDTSVWWNMYGTTNIADGVMHCIINNDYLCGKFISTIKIGGRYKLTYTITNVTSGSIKWSLSSGNTWTTPRNTVGTHIEYLTNVTNLIHAIGSADTVLDIDNVTLVEVDPLPTITKGTKYLECVTGGTIALQSSTAFGTWMFDIYIPTSSTRRVYIISNGINNYNITFSLNAIKLYKDLTNVELLSVASITTISTWYSIKITRNKLGVFTIFIKGGIYTNWINLGSATNLDITSSNYIEFIGSTNLTLTNLKIYNEVI